MTPAVRTAYRLVSMGVLPVWVAVLLVVCAATAALLLLRGELRGRRKRRAPALLYTARTLLVACLALLVIQPVLFIRRDWDQPGVLALIADRSRSMLRSDPYSRAAQLDLASASNRPGIERRDTLPGRIRQHLLALEAAAESWRQQVFAIQDELGQGLPWGAAFEETIGRLAKEAAARSRELRGSLDALGKLESRLSRPKVPPPDPKLFAAAYLVAEQLASLRDVLEKSTGPLDELRAAALLRAHDDLLASLRAAVPALAALQRWCDDRFLAEAPQEATEELAAISKRSRFELSAALARQIAEDPPVAARHRVRLLGFDELTPASALENTDLFAPIDQLLRDSLDEVVSGVVVLTDGRQNLPERPEVLRRLASRDSPLLLAGVGVGGELPGVAIEDCQAPGLLLGGQESELVVELRATVPKGTPIQVELCSGSKSLASQSLEADGTGQARVALRFRAPEACDDGLLLTAKTPESATAGLSSRAPGQVGTVGQADRGTGEKKGATAVLAPCVLSRPARALVVARGPRWDVVYLLSALRRKPCRVDLVLWGAAAERGVGRGLGFGKIPDQLDQLKRYDLVVLDGEPFPGMTQEDGLLFANYVRLHGGSLLLIADGDSQDFRLPIFDSRLAIQNPRSKTENPSLRDPHSAIRTHPAAASFPAVSVSLDPARTLAAWAALPPPLRFQAVPDQTIPLLTAGGRTLLSVGFHGRGKLYALGCGDLFRLREWGRGAGEALAEPPVNRFLANLLDDALQPLFRDGRSAVRRIALYPSAPREGSTAHVLLDTDGMRDEGRGARGEVKSLRLQVADSGLPIENRKSKIENGPVPLAFQPHAGSPGLARATFRVGAAGRITVEAPGVPPLAATVASAVSREDIDVTLDEPTLRRLASGQGTAGGAYVPLDGLARAIADLPPRLDHRVAIRQVRLCNVWGLLPALAALMAVDWVLRRRSGLVL